MSYYFAIIGTRDNPLFEHEFGTSKSGGDGVARFREEQRHLNQFVVHAALDLVEELQWGTGNMYLKHVDRHRNAYISAFITGSNAKFLLLHIPSSPAPSSASSHPSTVASRSSAARSSVASASWASSAAAGPGSGFGPGTAAAGAAVSTFNPTAPAVEEATKNFFLDVYEAWVKTVMSPFYSLNMPVLSPVFRARVQAAARKYL